jgi:ATP-dependent DNA helicase RecQ
MRAETKLLQELIGADAVTRPELLARARSKAAYVQPTDIERALQRALEDGHLREADGKISVPKTATGPEESPSRPRVERLVAFDLESIVRPITREPYREQHVFQIGGVRFGSDSAWVAESPEFSVFAALRKPEDEQLIYREEMKTRYDAGKQPLADVLEQFRSFCDGADCVIAYNGVAHDFRLLDEEYRRCELEPLLSGPAAPRLVDGLYLAQALWPIPPRQHRLKQLLQRLEIDVEDMIWHDALDDSKMLVELLTHGATELMPSLDPELQALLAAAGAGSDAWELLFSLAGIEPGGPALDGVETASILLDTLQNTDTKHPLRQEPPEDGAETPPLQPTALTIPATLLAPDGGVDIDKLVAVVKGEGAEAREAQREMVAQMRAWLEAGAPALVEAPTGTGKSYAILAAALDWLSVDPERKVVISTFTKQLQSQLAEDIENLTEKALPALSEAADMVKGAANRLSLRALVLALAELTEPDTPSHRRGRQDFSGDQRYRDLVLYLALRFVAEGKPTEQWEARSVDRVDVPAFFDDYCPQRLSLYLASFSQAENEDYRADRGGIGTYTLTVKEALELRRLVVANHALLLAHLDDFADLGEKTLLVVDEAHELENAATSALSSEIDAGAIAELAVQAAEWADENDDITGAARVADGALSLDRYLEDERLARAAMDAFDTAERDPLGRNVLRTVTVASPLQGDAFVRPMEILAGQLRTTRHHVGLVMEPLRRIAAQNPPSDPYELDRFYALLARAGELDTALTAIVHDVDAIFGPGTAPTAAASAGSDDGTGPAEAQDADPDQAELVEVVDSADEGEELVALEADEESEVEPEGADNELVEDGTALDRDRPNKVVFAEELSEYRPGRTRAYRFRIVSAPIELGREHDWREFKERFARAYYVSATLRVAEDWGFIRRRLDFPQDEVEAIALSSPFNTAEQAELVCFEDFPSWSEHTEAAMHTVAHQLDGYASELIGDEGE